MLRGTDQEAGFGGKWCCWHFTHSLTQNLSCLPLPLYSDSLFPRRWVFWNVSLQRASPIGMLVFWERGGEEHLRSHFLICSLLQIDLRDLWTEEGPTPFRDQYLSAALGLEYPHIE